MSKLIKTSLRLISFFIFTPFLQVNGAIGNLKVHEICHINSKQPIYVFSGSVAATVYKLGLFHDPAIKGILSSYEFVPTENIKFSAGIYLSQKIAETIDDNAVIFLEESKDLERTLDHVALRKKKHWKKISVNSKGQNPHQVSKMALEVLAPYLSAVKSCDVAKKNYLEKIDQYLKKIALGKKTLKFSKQKVYFFMGEWDGKFPESKALVVFHEGFIKVLMDHEIIPPYETDEVKIHYGPWSSKLFLRQDTTFIGIHSDLKDNQQLGKLVEVSANKYQVHCFACLIPGVLQLEWLSNLVSNEHN